MNFFGDTRQNPTRPLGFMKITLIMFPIPPPPHNENLRGTFNRKRSLTLPPLPETLDEVFIRNTWTKTLDYRNFLLHQESGIALFATDAGLNFFRQSKVLLGYGTFKTPPPPFLQIYVIYGTHDNFKIPVGLFLAQRQKKYIKKIFETLKNRCFEKILVREFIATDYETGVNSAISQVFSFSTQLGCWFHYTQCVYRKKNKRWVWQLYISRTHIFKNNCSKIIQSSFFTRDRIYIRVHGLSKLNQHSVGSQQKLSKFFDYIWNFWLFEAWS